MNTDDRMPPRKDGIPNKTIVKAGSGTLRIIIIFVKKSLKNVYAHPLIAPTMTGAAIF
jgi:hypothetical protein